MSAPLRRREGQTGTGIAEGQKHAALGLAYKPDVDDLRESPAVEVVHLLQREGAQVQAWEPFKPEANLRGSIWPPISLLPSRARARSCCS